MPIRSSGIVLNCGEIGEIVLLLPHFRPTLDLVNGPGWAHELGVALSSFSIGGALLAAMATRITVGSGQSAGKAGAIIHHRANASFELALRVLIAFDAAKPVSGGNYALAVDASEIDATWSVSARDPRFKEVLTAFLAVACRYDALPSGQSWFRPPQHLADVMDHFAILGYALVQSDLFCWAPQMEAYLSEAGVRNDRSEKAEADRLARQEAEARKAYDEMPVFVRKRFFTGPDVDLLAFLSVVAHCWDGNRWRPFTRERRYLDFPDARQLADRMIEYSAQTRRRERSPH